MTDMSAKQLVTLFKEAMKIPQSESLGGSGESFKSYYKMIRQFAAMADVYQYLIPEEYDALSILELPVLFQI